MKKIDVRPEKVRGMGNLIPPLSISDFELSSCIIHEEADFKINGHYFNHFSIDVPVSPVNLVLSTQYTSIYPDDTSPSSTVITATCTDSAGTPIPNMDVYFQENGVRIGTASTNTQGIATIEYTNSNGGVHTIHAYTTKQGKYNKSSAEINVNVFMPTNLNLTPAAKTVSTVDVVSLTSKITDQNGLPLPNKLIKLYYTGNGKVLKSARSNSRGIVTFSVTYPELRATKTNTLITVTTDKTVYSVGDKPVVTVTLTDASGNPLAGKSVTDNLSTPQTKTTDSDGKAVFQYVFTSAMSVFRKYSFKGDKQYNESSTSITLTCTEPAPTIKMAAVGGVVTGEKGEDIYLDLDESEDINVGETLELVEDGAENTVLAVCNVQSQSNTFKYTCTGAGDMAVKAKLTRGDNVYYSNVITIEDCIVYDPMTSNSNKWINGGATITYDDVDGTTITKTTSGEVKYKLDKQFTQPYIVEFEYRGGSGNGRLGIDGGSAWYVAYWNPDSKLNLYTFKSATASSKDNVSKVTSIKAGDKFKIVVEATHISVYLNGELTLSKDAYKLESPSILEFYTNNNYLQKIKNFKVKAYSE